MELEEENSSDIVSLYSQEEEEDEKEEEEEGIEEEEDGEEGTDPHSLQRGEFFGCYLLVSCNPKFNGRTYIGFTVDPNRRIRQHNAGKASGGARKTSGRGPWEMVLVVHGFPNEISALRFEWAWQHPDKSRRLGRKIATRRSKESPLQYRFRILTEMLLVGPWWRLPLTVRWLKQEYMLPFPLDKQPPVHMPIAYGQVEIFKKQVGDKRKETGGEKEIEMDTEGEKKIRESKEEEEKGEEEKQEGEGSDFSLNSTNSCFLCQEKSTSQLKPQLLHCYHSDCPLTAHSTCLAQWLCPAPHLLPTIGSCPACSRELLWGEVVRRGRAGGT